MLTELTRQLDLLAQRRNFENWENLVLLLVMVVFWLVGVVGKVIMGGKKTSQKSQRQGGPATRSERPRETWQQRIARKAQEFQRAAEAQRRTMEQQAGGRAQTAKPRPAGEIAIRTDQRGESVMVYQPPATDREHQAARQREARDAVLAARQQTALEPPKPIEPPQGLTRVASSPESDAYQSLPAIDYSGPDALKNAILHYEILGKPLALREPSQGDIVF